jgi:glutamyl-tRNA synthetase
LVYGDLSRSNAELDDFVCARADGRPTYNFACVIDDHDMKISHVIRGNDHITNTFKQVLIYRALGVDPPLFAHLPLNLGKDRRKISKREGATSVIEYQQMGFLPEALVNFLALLGWSPGDEREIMTREELVEAFSLDRVNPSNPIFDMQKLEWMNGEYIRNMSTNELLERLTPVLMDSGLVTRLHIQTHWSWMLRIVGTLRERIRLLNDVVEQGAFYFTDRFDFEEKGVRKYFTRPGAAEDLALLMTEFERTPESEFTKEHSEKLLRQLSEQLGRQPAELIHPLRLALSGKTTGPGLFDIVEILGRDRCVERLRKAIHFIRESAPLP